MSHPFPFRFKQVLNLDIPTRLKEVASRLVDQQHARVIVPPQRPGTGHWFGGGNLVQDQNGSLWLTGRFRNQGDSRTGLGQVNAVLNLQSIGPMTVVIAFNRHSP